MTYLWLKVVHILAVTAWMAGLFYLPRLFVYHVDQKPGSETDVTFKTMERRLLGAIMRPAAVVTVLSGLGLFHVLSLDWAAPWVVMKLAAVAGMLVVHGLLERYVVRFRRGDRGASSRYFRILNEFPTVLLIMIVIAVVLRPFS